MSENLCAACGAKYDNFVENRGFMYIKGKPYCMKCYPKYHKIAAKESMKNLIKVTKEFNASLKAHGLI